MQQSLGDFLGKLPESDQLFLVGHSMGGLVIQSLLVQTMQEQRGTDLVKIRCFILFATPNLGSTILSGLRGIFSIFRENPQEDLKVLDEDVAKISAVILRSVLGAKSADTNNCLSHFVFFGAFKMTSCLRFPPAVHSWRRALYRGDTKRSYDAVQMIPTTRDTKPSRTHSLIL